MLQEECFKRNAYYWNNRRKKKASDKLMKMSDMNFDLASDNLTDHETEFFWTTNVNHSHI
jgi:hypothetical protein